MAHHASSQKFFRFSNLGAIGGLRHAITTRSGGVSDHEFATLNLGFHVDDNADTVRENRDILAKELGFEVNDLVAAQQVHGDTIRVVTTADAGRGALDWETAIPTTDALITAEKNLPLLILVADCAPLLMVDSNKGVLAVIHAGWRGALAGIAGKTAVKMGAKFGSRPEDLHVGIGSCLSTENLEVGVEVAAQIAAVDASVLFQRPEWEKPHLDLRALIVHDLIRVGLEEQHIEVMLYCPKEHNDLFFRIEVSRGERGVSGWWLGGSDL